jgi:hypothetical protein
LGITTNLAKVLKWRGPFQVAPIYKMRTGGYVIVKKLRHLRLLMRVQAEPGITNKEALHNPSCH